MILYVRISPPIALYITVYKVAHVRVLVCVHGTVLPIECILLLYLNEFALVRVGDFSSA